MISDENIEGYIKQLGKQKRGFHAMYEDAVDHAEQMAVHVYGDKPSKLLSEYRPNETQKIHEYRLSIYEPITVSKFQKVLNILYRGFNTRLYSIAFKEIPARIEAKEAPESYLMERLPFYKNLIAYFRAVVYQSMIADPNGIVAIIPTSFNFSPTEYVEPFPFIFDSAQVYDMVPGHYFTILTSEKSEVKNTTGKKEMTGDVFLLITKDAYYKIIQTGEKAKRLFTWEKVYEHNLGEVPARRMGGIVDAGSFPFCFKSYCSGVLPFWNSAIRINSDLNANYVQHLYLERVEIEVECDAQGCRDGIIKDREGNKGQCTKCKGSGFIKNRTPYGKRVLDKGAFGGENPPPFPGVQYIDKPTNIVELTEKKVQSLINQGFESLNMDILKNVGENQSGIAKAIDRQDLDTFLLQVTNAIFDLMEFSIRKIIELRYSNIMAGNTSELMPEITRPQNFDILGIKELTTEISEATSSGINQAYINGLVLDTARKRFGDGSEISKITELTLRVEPFPGKSEDDKFLMKQNGGATLRDYVLSSNLKQILNEAISTSDNFLGMPETEQDQIIGELVTRKIQELRDENIIIESPIPVE